MGSHVLYKPNQTLVFQGLDLGGIAQCYTKMHAYLPGVASYTLHGRLDRLEPMVVPASFGLKKNKQSEIL